MTALSVENLSIRYGPRAVVKGADLHVGSGEVLGLVGESGSGKSTLARAVCGLIPIASGEIRLDGKLIERGRGRSPIQMVFQNPAASLNPKMSVAASISEALEWRFKDRRARKKAAGDYLELVGLSPELAARLPGALSGGQKQRVAIARAIAADPAVLVADEITSALDLSVQAAVLNLIADLRKQLSLTILFISHNLAAVRYLCDTTAVMFEGEILESGPTRDVIRTPDHAYTRALVDAVPAIVSPTASRKPRNDASCQQ